MIKDWFDKKIEIKRMETTTGYKKSFVSIVSDLPAHIQPRDFNIEASDDFMMGKMFICFVKFTDIKENDKILEGSKEYVVIGLEHHTIKGVYKHTEVLIKL